MTTTEHAFTDTISQILRDEFGENGDGLFRQSPLIQYLNIKTRSADRGSKSRANFANIYAVLVLDYVERGYDKKEGYSTQYEGAIYSELMIRIHRLPFGEKIQNHALNHRLNSEFEKYFPVETRMPVVRNRETNRYWFNESLLKERYHGRDFLLARAVIRIIDEYVQIKQGAFDRFIKTCVAMLRVKTENAAQLKDFIFSLLAPQVDARLFEIVSYSILRQYYCGQTVYWGFDKAKLQKDSLALYKTGRTNANDGGIDFVMRPLGRFFQVTETVDFKKYFLDIDKIEKYPITFVVKTEWTAEQILAKIESDAKKRYSVAEVVRNYMVCIEEVINLPLLRKRFDDVCRT